MCTETAPSSITHHQAGDCRGKRGGHRPLPVRPLRSRPADVVHPGQIQPFGGRTVLLIVEAKDVRPGRYRKGRRALLLAGPGLDL